MTAPHPPADGNDSQPCEIRHVDRADPAPAPLDPARSWFLVFWDGDLPREQAILRAGTFTDLSPLAHLPDLPPAPKLADAPPGTVSVVICTRDRPEQLARCLASLGGQSRRPDQLLVVDNASVSPQVREAALAAGADYVREDRPGLDHARNAGAAAAAGDYVLYTDDDVELHPRWIERASAAFNDDAVWAMTGLVLPGSLQTRAEQDFEFYWGFGRGYERVDFDPAFYARTRHSGCPVWHIGAGANMGFRKGVIERVGWFDPRLDVGAAGCSGDSEMWYRILHAGGTIRYEPAAVLSHFHRPDADGLSRQVQAYMSGHTAALLVQFERTGDVGNLVRLIGPLPYFFLKRAARAALKRRPTPHLRAAIRGCFQGIGYYRRAPKAAAFPDRTAGT